MEIIHIPYAPVHLQILGHKNPLADAQVIDARRHGGVMYQRVGAGGAAGDNVQLPPDGVLHAAGKGKQLLHLLHRRLDGAVAAQIGADTRQLHVGQRLFHIAADRHQFIIIVKTLPQIAQLRHDNDAVASVLPGTLALQGRQRIPFALERHLAQRHGGAQLAQGGNPHQKEGRVNTGGAAGLHLLETAGAKRRRSAGEQQPRHLRQTAAALYHAAHIHARGTAACNDFAGVVAELVHVQRYKRIFPVHIPASHSKKSQLIRLEHSISHFLPPRHIKFSMPPAVDLHFYPNRPFRLYLVCVRYFNMKIKVLGKAHLEGVAKKTGKPYDFNQVHYLGHDRRVIGQAALTLALDPSVVPFDSIVVGKEYVVDCDPRGYVVDFAPVG